MKVDAKLPCIFFESPVVKYQKNNSGVVKNNYILKKIVGLNDKFHVGSSGIITMM